MSFQHYDQDGYDDEYYDQGGDGVMITMAWANGFEVI
jgi:hypothetical protein